MRIFFGIWAIFGSICALASAPLFDNLVVEPQPSPGSSMAVKCSGFIHAHPQFVWQALTDYRAFPEFMPNIRGFKIIKEEGSVAWAATEFSVAFVTLNYVARIVHEQKTKPWKISWSRTEGDLKTVEGYYVLEEVSGGTRLLYSSLVDSGMSVPKFIQESLSKRSIPGLYDAVATRAVMYGKKAAKAK